MKLSLGKFTLVGSLCVLAVASASCGKMDDLLSKSEKGAGEALTSDTDTNNLIDGTFSAAAGSSEPSLRPFPMSELNGFPPPEGLGRGHHGGPGGHGGPRRGDDHGRGKGPAPMPPEILELMKAADAKKDKVLGIDRTKVDEILKAMRTDLDALRLVAVSRVDFQSQAKVIQDKYAAQLKAILPAFESLTEEQKARVKTIHDLQRTVIKSCVIPGADAASTACATAKINLQADIDAP